jgi:hypothetical protein
LIINVSPRDTPDDILKFSGENLNTQTGVDVGLVEILTAGLLKDSPALGSVIQAKRYIQYLAVKRFSPPKAEAKNE